MPMPPPPPPGPPPPGPPPPSMPAFTPKKGGGGQDNRGALLQSIRQGTKLKKAVTVDKSAPVIPGKVSSNTSSNNDLGRTKYSSNTNSQPVSNGLALGGLFAGGMPKLRPTGLRSGTTPSLNVANNGSDNSRKPSPEPTRQNTVSSAPNVSQLNEVLRRQMSGDIRNRGPPPQPPTPRNPPAVDLPDSTASTPRYKTSPDSPLPNKSSLHRYPPQSLPSLPTPPPTNGSSTPSPVPTPTNTRPAISHGKPNVAPKPPPLGVGSDAGSRGGSASSGREKPATPPKKLGVNGRTPVSRAQSMRVPRSPPVAPGPAPFPPGTVNGKDFGTIRGIPSAFHSQENLTRPLPHHSRNQTLPVNLLKSTAPQPPISAAGSSLSLSGRPSVPPPSRPPVPPPPSRTAGVKAPLSPPPPPPVVPGGLGGAPPPPPHRSQAPPPPSHTRPPPAIPTNGPPPPPVRNSSMRPTAGNNPSSGGGNIDFDTRFSNLFHPVTDFPSPPRFAGFNKVYNNKNAANKQQAPLPPNSVHLGNKLWESSTC